MGFCYCMSLVTDNATRCHPSDQLVTRFLGALKAGTNHHDHNTAKLRKSHQTGQQVARPLSVHGAVAQRPPQTYEQKYMGERWLNEERRLIDLGEWTPPAVRKELARQEREQNQTTVAVCLDHWLARQTHLRESSRQVYQRTINNRLSENVSPAVAQFVTTPIAKVDRAAVYKWWDSITEQFDTPTTNCRAHIYLRSAFSDAVERELIPANPVDVKAARTKPVTKDKKLPETSTLQAIVDNAPARYRFVLVLCLFMGLRVGEAIAVKRENLRNDGTEEHPRWVVEVRGNLQRLNGENGVYLQWQPPKTKAGLRDVPIFDAFNPVVAEHLENFVPGAPGEYLTTTAAGKPVMDTSLRNRLERACEAAGFHKKEVTPHYGRNWLITHLAEIGATPAEIGHVLGQEDLKTITEIYMKVRPGNVQEMMDRVNARLSGGVASLSEHRRKKEQGA